MMTPLDRDGPKLILVCLLMLIPLLGGCMTGGLWSEVGPTQVESPFIAGQAHRSGTGRSATPAALVVVYQLPYTFRPHSPPSVWLKVPLDATGAPAAPFAYHGAARTPEAVAADLRSDQLAAARAATARLAFGRGKEPSRNFHAFDIEPQSHRNWQKQIGEIRIFAYRMGPTGTIVPLFDDQPWPADAHVAIFPVKTTRPPADQANARLTAILLTPLAVAVDAACVPLAILAIFGGGWC